MSSQYEEDKTLWTLNQIIFSPSVASNRGRKIMQRGKKSTADHLCGLNLWETRWRHSRFGQIFWTRDSDCQSQIIKKRSLSNHTHQLLFFIIISLLSLSLWCILSSFSKVLISHLVGDTIDSISLKDLESHKKPGQSIRRHQIRSTTFEIFLSRWELGSQWARSLSSCSLWL